ncbi:hypothetical protein, partial [Desulfomicrobium apsheronum]|uniref:hypothetical protein n=1 Tax=Desulfomicrobium apsheronum TaxID=52560 RepID=UPI001C4364B4
MGQFLENHKVENAEIFVYGFRGRSAGSFRWTLENQPFEARGFLADETSHFRGSDAPASLK